MKLKKNFKMLEVPNKNKKYQIAGIIREEVRKKLEKKSEPITSNLPPLQRFFVYKPILIFLRCWMRNKNTKPTTFRK
jgi:hypothetical protein